MSAEENKELVRRFVEEFWNEGNAAAADELMAPDAEIHMPTGEVVDLDGLKGFAATFRGSFPDWHSTLEELVAEGDRVGPSGGPAGARTWASCKGLLLRTGGSRCPAASSTGSLTERSWSFEDSST